MAEKQGLKLQRFKPRDIKTPARICFLGTSGCGKTTCMEHVMKDIGSHFPNAGVIMSETEVSNGTWGKHCPKLLISDSWNEGIVKEVIAEQMVKTAELQAFPEKAACTNIEFFVIAEDVATENEFRRKGNMLHTLFAKGRHYGITFLFTAWNARDLGTYMRNGLSYIFLWYVGAQKERELLWRDYVSMISFSEFCEIMDTVCENRRCLVIDLTKDTRLLTERLFWFKATPNLNFRLGNQSLWDYCDKRTYTPQERFMKLKQKRLYQTDSVLQNKRSVSSVAKNEEELAYEKARSRAYKQARQNPDFAII